MDPKFSTCKHFKTEQCLLLFYFNTTVRDKNVILIYYSPKFLITLEQLTINLFLATWRKFYLQAMSFLLKGDEPKIMINVQRQIQN